MTVNVPDTETPNTSLATSKFKKVLLDNKRNKRVTMQYRPH